MKKLMLITMAIMMSYSGYSQKLQKGETIFYSFDLSKTIDGKTSCTQKENTPCNTSWQQDTNNKTLYVKPEKENISSVYEFPAINIDPKNLDKALYIVFQQNYKLGRDAKFVIEVESKKGEGTLEKQNYQVNEKQSQKINIIKAIHRNSDNVTIRFRVNTEQNFKCKDRCIIEIIDPKFLFCCGGTNTSGTQMPPPRGKG